MEVLLKAAGLLLVSGCAALVIRRYNPELSLVLSAAAVCCVLILTIPLAQALQHFRETICQLYGVGDIYLYPLMKCCAAALIARLTADLCREASQNAAASAVELMGVLCALGAAVPLIRSMLKAIGELL